MYIEILCSEKQNFFILSCQYILVFYVLVTVCYVSNIMTFQIAAYFTLQGQASGSNAMKSSSKLIIVQQYRLFT